MEPPAVYSAAFSAIKSSFPRVPTQRAHPGNLPMTKEMIRISRGLDLPIPGAPAQRIEATIPVSSVAVMMLAILFANICAPLIDYFVVAESIKRRAARHVQ